MLHVATVDGLKKWLGTSVVGVKFDPRSSKNIHQSTIFVGCSNFLSLRPFFIHSGCRARRTYLVCLHANWNDSKNSVIFWSVEQLHTLRALDGFNQLFQISRAMKQAFTETERRVNNTNCPCSTSFLSTSLGDSPKYVITLISTLCKSVNIGPERALSTSDHSEYLKTEGPCMRSLLYVPQKQSMSMPTKRTPIGSRADVRSLLMTLNFLFNSPGRDRSTLEVNFNVRNAFRSPRDMGLTSGKSDHK